MRVIKVQQQHNGRPPAQIYKGVKMSVGEDCNSNQTATDVNITSFGSTAGDEYQWFLDYTSHSQHQPTSVLSSLAACEQLSYYNDLALAEVDMEDFRTEDIHSVLSTLPAMCCPQIQAEHEGEMYASVSGSLMCRYDLDTSISPHSSSHGCDESAGSTMSICKSELLFSPVRECPLPVAGNFSVDSLDCDDLLITCQANKDNYTIAFEASDESEYRYNGAESEAGSSHSEKWPESPRKPLDTSMARSESIYTTWSKLRQRSSALQLRRHGNNNMCLQCPPSDLKSQSLPNLSRRQLAKMTTSETRCVKIYDMQSLLSYTNSSISCGSNSKKSNLSLIKLFMKQKSCSNEGMSVSSVSECWPLSNNSQSDSDFYVPDAFNRPRIPQTEETDCIGFEDSLVAERKHGLIEEEDERSASVEQISESIKIDESILDLDMSSSSSHHSKPKCSIRFNVNNNNSIERVMSPAKQRFCRGQGTQTRKGSDGNSVAQGSYSCSYSSGEDTEATKIRVVPSVTSHTQATQIPLHLIDRSIQTSCIADANNGAPFQLLESPNGTSLVKLIVPTDDQKKKPVYVFYPNYTLPNLDFLREKRKDLDVEQVYLLPQKLEKESPLDKTPPSLPTKPERRFSPADMSALCKKGFGHVQDWDSLTFLLPREYRQILADIPEIMSHFKDKDEELKPLFCVSPRSKAMKTRPLSFDCTVLDSHDAKSKEGSFWPSFNTRTKPRPRSLDCTAMIPGNTQQISSTSSSATQPSSGYRGSPTMLTDSSQNQTAYNPLFVYNYDSASLESSLFSNAAPDRKAQGVPKRATASKNLPPRSILRNIPEHYNCKSHKNDANKRYSMFELGTDNGGRGGCKRRSFSVDCDEKDVDEMEDEGVDAGTGTDSSVEEAHHDAYKDADLEMIRLEELLHLSGLSALKSSAENLTFDDTEMSKLRLQVSKFLTMQDETCCANLSDCGRKKTVSFAESRDSGEERNPMDTISKKAELVRSVSCSVERLVAHFTAARDSNHCTDLGDSNLTPAIGHLLLNTLCASLYAVMSHGLKPSIQTTFGVATNSVWQVIEATAQQGPLAKSLNDLVLTINTEHGLTEGLIKFNAFIFGLLNVGGVDAWLGFVRTRDSVLRKHYSADGLFVMANTTGAAARMLTDQLLNSVKLLNLLPFNLDLLFECKQLQQSLSRMDTRNTSPTNKSWNFMKLVRSFQTSQTQDRPETSLNEGSTNGIKARPRSCVETFTNATGASPFPDIASSVQKRWSNININSKLFQAFDRLAGIETEEEYSDSLEHTPRTVTENGSPDVSSDDKTDTTCKLNDTSIQSEGGKFRRLQMKWEMMSGKEAPEAANLEKASPISPTQCANPIRSRIPRLVTSPVRPTSPPLKKLSIPASKAPPRSAPARTAPVKRPPIVGRISRAEQLVSGAKRPTSLPYKKPVQETPSTTTRRAVSSTRRVDTTPPRFVRTLCHHLASDNGHLTFKEGERLRVVLEVDSRWLLCCRGDSKGLVPRTSVIRDNT